MNFVKEVLINNNNYIYLYFMLCALTSFFFFLCHSFKKQKRNLSSLKNDKNELFLFQITFIPFLVFIVLFLRYFEKLFSITVLFFSSFLLIGLFIFLALKEHQTYLSRKLEPTFRICPECETINNMLIEYIKNNSSNKIYNSSVLHTQLSNYEKSSIKILLDDLNSCKSNQNTISFSIMFLIFGIFIGKLLEQIPLNLGSMDGFSVALMTSLIWISLPVILFMTYFILRNLESPDTNSIKVSLLKIYLYSN